MSVVAASQVRSYDEFTSLEEVVVGVPDSHPPFHLEPSFCLFFWDNLRSFLASKSLYMDSRGTVAWPELRIEEEIVRELVEDVEGFAGALQRLGVVVRRPARVSTSERIRSPFWETVQTPALNVRDQTIVLGDTIVETAPHVRARVFENDYLKPLFNEYFSQGANWVCMPRPAHPKGSPDPSFHDLSEIESKALQQDIGEPLPGLGREMVFDGAQCIRIGQDVLVNVASEGHRLGLRWLRANFANLRFHQLDGLSDGHLDSTLLPLRPGLWLVRGAHVMDALPPAFRKWDYLVAPEAGTDLFPSYAERGLSIASTFIDMNVLSVREDTVVVNSLFPELMSLLERNSFTVVPVRHRHRRLFGGGFHCFTLDVRRSGGAVDYR